MNERLLIGKLFFVSFLILLLNRYFKSTYELFNVTCNKNGDESLYINDTFVSLIKDLKREIRFKSCILFKSQF